MKFNEIKYEKKWNLGNYEHEMITVSVGVEDSDPKVVLQDLMTFVHSKGMVAVESTKMEPAVVKETIKEEPPVKKEVKKKELTPEPEVKTIEVKEEPKNGKEKSSKKDKKDSKEVVDKTATPYDRTNDVHKKILVSMLEKDSGGKWKTKATEVKEASMKFNGKAFLDKEGIVLETFKADFLKEIGL